MRQERKTILYVGGFELPDRNAAAQRVMANGKLLRDLGYEVAYIGVDRKTASAAGIESAELQSCGFACWAMPYPDSMARMLRHLTSIDGVMRVIARIGPANIAALICYNYPSVAMWRLQRRLGTMKIPIISDCTEWYLPEGRGPLSYLCKRFDTALRMRLLNGRCRGIVTVSRFLTEYYKGGHYGLVELPPLTDCEDDKWRAATPDRGGGGIRFVYMGEPFAGRGCVKDRIDLVIEILHKHRQRRFELRVVGIDMAEYVDRYPQHRDIVADMGGSLTFHGRVTHSRAILMLRSADFLVFFRDTTLATRAGFPTKFAEAVSAGVPVVTNRTSCIADYCEGANLGILADGADRKSLEHALDCALRLTRSERDAMKESCRRSRKFDYRNYREKTRAFLAEVLDSHA